MAFQKNKQAPSPQDKVRELTDKLEAGVSELFQSDRYRQYLRTMEKFHNYSANNAMLIYMQKPDASLVAGYGSWQTNFGRQVQKGEKAIRIFAPCPFKEKMERERTNFETGKVEKETVEVERVRFQAAAVFDVSQTDGKPLPEIANKLTGQAPNFASLWNALQEASPVPITAEGKIESGANGFYDHAEKRIAVQAGLSEQQTLKTAIHEVAHSLLHDKDTGTETEADRNTREIQAESIAYVVAGRYGLDTSEYSFGYIAGWSEGQDTAALKKNLEVIQRTSSHIIKGVDKSLLQEQQNARPAASEQKPKQYNIEQTQTMVAERKAEGRSTKHDGR